MKKLLAFCMLVTLVGMLGISNTLATSENQDSLLKSIFESVSNILDGFNPDPEERHNDLKITNLSQIRNAAGQVVNGNDDYLQAVDTDKLVLSESVAVNGVHYSFWPRSTKATDKIISVQNTAKKAVYFRSAMLIKCSSTIWQNMKLNLNKTDYTWQNKTIKIGDNTYPLLIATYNSKLEGGKISPPMLLQLAIDESVVGALDQFDFKTQTFAVQAEAFDTETAADALNAAIPLENIALSFGGSLNEQ